MTSMRTQLEATFARYVPAPFVGPPSLARLLQVAGSLPGAASTFFGFECRLGAAPAEADFAVCIGRDGASCLAEALEVAAPGPEPVWLRLAAFFRQWAAHDEFGIANLWLEFDLVGSRVGAPLPVPSLFVGPRDELQNGEDLRAENLVGALDRLVADDAGRCAALRRALTALPPGGRLFQLGVMLGRPDPGLRLCVSGLLAPEIDGFLDRLGCPDADGSRATLLGSLAPITADVRLGLDARGTQVMPRIGMELRGGEGAAAAGRWQGIIEFLLARGLAEPAQLTALGAWWGLQHSRLLKQDWPATLDTHPSRPSESPAGAIWRSVHHVKLAWAPRTPLAAKAYLAARLVWPEEVTIRRLLAELRAS
jgi:hypothetical protein